MYLLYKKIAKLLQYGVNNALKSGQQVKSKHRSKNTVIPNLKFYYRNELVRMTRDAIESANLSSNSSAGDVSQKVSPPPRFAIRPQNWMAVKQSTIQNCFHKGGFRV